MSEKEVLVPNIGDFKDVEVIEVLIEAGSNINKDDPIITIESDKSSVEIPSPYSGSVKKVNLNMVDTPLLNQHSYKVDASKIKRLGYHPRSNIYSEIKKTITLFDSVN